MYPRGLCQRVAMHGLGFQEAYPLHPTSLAVRYQIVIYMDVLPLAPLVYTGYQPNQPPGTAMAEKVFRNCRAGGFFGARTLKTSVAGPRVNDRFGQS